MARWLRQKGIHVSEVSTWESTVAELGSMLRAAGDTDASYVDCMDSKGISADSHVVDSQANELHGSGNDSSLVKPRALAILDVAMAPKTSDLEMFHRFSRHGVIIAWLLKHDTPSSVKGELRKLGFTNMVNKPVYKSKLLQLLRVMVGCVRDVESGKVKSDLCKQDDLTCAVDDGISTLNKLSRGAAYHLSPLRPQFQTKQCPVELLRSQSFGGMDRRVEDDQSESGYAGIQRRLSEQSPLPRGSSYLQVKPGVGSNSGFETSSEFRSMKKMNDAAFHAERSCRGEPFSEVPLEDRGLGCSVEGGLVMRGQGAVSGSVGKISTSDDDRRTGVEREEKDNAVANGTFPAAAGDALGQGDKDVGAIRNAQGLSTEGVKPSPQAVSSRTVKPPASRIGPDDALKGIRIILAEDNPVLQRVATIMLEKMGAKVLPVRDGLEALHALAIDADPSKGVSRDHRDSPDSFEVGRQLNTVDGSPFDLVLMDCQVITAATFV